MNQCTAQTIKGQRCLNKTVYNFCNRHKPDFCRRELNKKIKINIEEYKTGRWKSPKQAVAVSYNQIKRKYPKCTFNKIE